MKKMLAVILSVALLSASVVAFAACGSSKVSVFDAKEFELTTEGYAFCLTKGNEEIKTAANALLAEIKANGKLDEIITSFFDGTSEFVYENTVNSVPTDKDKYLVVATNAEFPPFEYTSGNKFTGVDIQIASLLAEKMGKTLYVNDMKFDSVISEVKSGTKCNIGMAGITVNDERKKQVDFTDEYYESAQVLVTKENDSRFKDCKTADDIKEVLGKQDKSFVIGTQTGTTGFMYSGGNADFSYDGFTNLTTKGYDSGALAVKDLSNGKIDAVIIDKQPAIMIAKSING